MLNPANLLRPATISTSRKLQPWDVSLSGLPYFRTSIYTYIHTCIHYVHTSSSYRCYNNCLTLYMEPFVHKETNINNHNGDERKVNLREYMKCRHYSRRTLGPTALRFFLEIRENLESICRTCLKHTIYLSSLGIS